MNPFSIVGQIPRAPVPFPTIAEQVQALNAGRVCSPPPPSRLPRVNILHAQMAAAVAARGRPVTNGRLRRLAELVAWVEEQPGGVTAQQMAEFSSVTPDSIRNDISLLKRAGFLGSTRIKHPGRTGPQVRYTGAK